MVFHITEARVASLKQYLFTKPFSEIINDRQIIQIQDHCINVNLRHSELPYILRSEFLFQFLGLPDVLLVPQQAYGLSKESCVVTLFNTFDVPKSFFTNPNKNTILNVCKYDHRSIR